MATRRRSCTVGFLLCATLERAGGARNVQEAEPFRERVSLARSIVKIVTFPAQPFQVR